MPVMDEICRKDLPSIPSNPYLSQNGKKDSPVKSVRFGVDSLGDDGQSSISKSNQKRNFKDSGFSNSAKDSEVEDEYDDEED